MHRPLSILYVVPSFQIVTNGGVAVSSLAWIKALSRQGHHVGVYLFLEGKSFLVREQALELVHDSPEQPIQAGFKLMQCLKPDLIHHHTTRQFEQSKTLSLEAGVPLVNTLHALFRVLYEMGLDGSESALANEAAAVDAADHLIAVSDSEAQYMSTYFPGTGSHTSVVGHGIDDTEAARQAVTSRKASQPPIIFSPGRLDYLPKGINELCLAIPKILEQVPSARFVLIGGDKVVDNTIPEPIADLLPYKYIDQLEFLGLVSPEQMRKWYTKANILVVPSRYESFGLVVQEGMLHGMAVAASRVGGPAEILKHETNGLLFTPQDENAIAATLLRLINEPMLRMSLAGAAARDARETWNWKKLVAQMERAYHRSISDYQRK